MESATFLGFLLLILAGIFLSHALAHLSPFLLTIVIALLQGINISKFFFIGSSESRPKSLDSGPAFFYLFAVAFASSSLWCWARLPLRALLHFFICSSFR
jgi:hypothetical protein